MLCARPGPGHVAARRSGVPGVHAGRVPAGSSDARCAALEVPRKTIDDAFPAAAETELLVHARQVDPAETEYADSDGWVSVVIANRLPQPGQAYAAYLISLEGQRDVLPPPGDVEQGGIRPGVFDDLVDLEDLLDIRVIGGDPVLPPVGPVGPIGPVGPVGPFLTNDARRRARGGTGDRARGQLRCLQRHVVAPASCATTSTGRWSAR